MRDDSIHVPLPIAFYDRNPIRVALDLVGKRLVRRTREGLAAGRIVEVEAYLARNDPASHSFVGPRPRNRSMFGPPGRSYVYASRHHFCLNAVTQAAGVASAVLIRALEPVVGLALMHSRRRTVDPATLAKGPGNLCKALAVDLELDGWDLSQGRKLWVAGGPDESAAVPIEKTRRVNIARAEQYLLRFYEAGTPFLSGPKHRQWSRPVVGARRS